MGSNAQGYFMHEMVNMRHSGQDLSQMLARSAAILQVVRI